MKRLKNFLFLLAAAPVLAFASGATVHLDKAPVNLADQESLQRGARMFVNYCLNCHSAGSMRYSRMQDLGLTEDQIKDNLMFAAEKPGETMKVAMTKADGKAWFGATPPDLSVISRSRGADWLYTYLRSFYRDDTPCHRLEQHRVRQGGHAARAVGPAGRNGAGLQERGRA